GNGKQRDSFIQCFGSKIQNEQSPERARKSPQGRLSTTGCEHRWLRLYMKLAPLYSEPSSAGSDPPARIARRQILRWCTVTRLYEPTARHPVASSSKGGLAGRSPIDSPVSVSQATMHFPAISPAAILQKERPVEMVHFRPIPGFPEKWPNGG